MIKSVLVIGNFSDTKCGFRVFSDATVTALANAGLTVGKFDGTYSEVYRRREQSIGRSSFFPDDITAYDVVHIIWHPATMNHYAGAEADWPSGVVKSQWNGCPAASCPFADRMDVRWGVLGREKDHRQLWYPVPDWIPPHTLPPSSPEFTVGFSGVREDGLGLIKAVCAEHGWTMNLSTPGVWLTLEEEIARLARSSVNAVWYGKYDDRGGSVMMSLASYRPQVLNIDSPMSQTLKGYPGFYDGRDEDVATPLLEAYHDWQFKAVMKDPALARQELSWTRAVEQLVEGWTAVQR